MKSKFEIRENRPYIVCPTDELRTMCIKNDWFTSGSINQYEKMFEANYGDSGFTTKDIAAIIWVCSNAEYEDILEKLTAKSEEFIQRLYEAEDY